MTKRSGSRNVFKDIGVPKAEEHLVKAQLVLKIDTILGSAVSSKLKPPSFSAYASLMSPRCYGASSGSFRSNGCYVFLSRSIKTWRSL
jgi:hypothetical protein